MPTSSPLKLLDDSYESQLICSLYLDIYNRDEEMQKLLLDDSYESQLICSLYLDICNREEEMQKLDDFKAPTFTNTKVAAKLNGHFDLFESCSNTKNATRSVQEDRNLSHRPFATRQTIGEVSKIHQYSKPQNDSRVISSKQKESDSHIPSNSKELDSVKINHYSNKRSRNNVIGNRAGQKKGKLRKPTLTEDRLDFLRKSVGIEKVQRKI